MRNADSSLVLPYQSAEQHYSSLSNLKQIQSVDDNKLLQFFKPYYQKQQYSLSGYFHISSTRSFDDLCTIPQVEEWLDTYNSSIKLCPSQSEEMMQIGALCYSNIFIYREDLKAAIIDHPLWNPVDDGSHLIFDLYLSGFIAAGKKTEMIFVSVEKSKAK